MSFKRTNNQQHGKGKYNLQPQFVGNTSGNSKDLPIIDLTTEIPSTGFVICKIGTDIYQKVVKLVKQKVDNMNNKEYRVKGNWTHEEDENLLRLVKKHGPKKWSFIATHLKGRIGKQCRERWLNHLDPSIRKLEWTEEEDQTIIRLHQEHGNSWSRIAKASILSGRTPNMIKNRWNSTLKKKAKGEGKDGVTRKRKTKKRKPYRTRKLPTQSFFQNEPDSPKREKKKKKKKRGRPRKNPPMEEIEMEENIHFRGGGKRQLRSGRIIDMAETFGNDLSVNDHEIPHPLDESFVPLKNPLVYPISDDFESDKNNIFRKIKTPPSSARTDTPSHESLSGLIDQNSIEHPFPSPRMLGTSKQSLTSAKQAKQIKSLIEHNRMVQNNEIQNDHGTSSNHSIDKYVFSGIPPANLNNLYRDFESPTLHLSSRESVVFAAESGIRLDSPSTIDLEMWRLKQDSEDGPAGKGFIKMVIKKIVEENPKNVKK